MSKYLTLEAKQFAKIKPKAEKIFKFDMIHLEKLMEVSQYSLVAFVIALLGAGFINRNLQKTKDQLKQTSTRSLVLTIAWSTILIAVFAKYIPKIVDVCPFLFWWDPHYKPNWHGEASYGISVAMGLAFYTVLFNYYAILTELVGRIMPGSFPDQKDPVSVEESFQTQYYSR